MMIMMMMMMMMMTICFLKITLLFYICSASVTLSRQRIRSKFYVTAHNIYCEVQYFTLQCEFLFHLWTGVKGKVLPVQAMETHLRSGIINLLIRNLNHKEIVGSEWSNPPSCLKGGQPFYWRLDRHQNRSGRLGEERNLSSQPRIEPRLAVMKPVASALHRRLWNLMYQIRNIISDIKKRIVLFLERRELFFFLKHENCIFVWKKIIEIYPKGR